MAELLQPYLAGMEIPPDLLSRCRQYLDLLLRWNAKTNLTAVRDPEQLVTRQLGESLFAARLVGTAGTLLDFGSGAGFPGIPLQLLRPSVQVTLAESQHKKAAFLREAVRTLDLPCEVWSGRVEDLPATRSFGYVTMRAVDHSDSALAAATSRVAVDGRLLRFLPRDLELPLADWSVEADLAIPQGGRIAALRCTANVPRGTL